MKDENAYVKIAEKIEISPVTAPKVGGQFSRAFLDYLKLVYKPEEAELIQHLRAGTKMKSAVEVAKLSGVPEEKVKETLEPLVKKGRLVGFAGNYAIPPMPLLLNIHQFRETVEADDLEAAKLYQQFFIKEGYYKYYESSEKGTPLMRTIVIEESLAPGQKILDTEEAHRIISAEPNLRLVSCPCRTRTEKLGIRECKDENPVGYCIMTGMSALYFEQAGIGKKVTAEEAIRYYDEMQELGLVGTTDNFEANQHSVICLCCECCCSQLRGRTRWDNPYSVAPSNFVAEVSDACLMCGTCVERCKVEAIKIDEQQERAVVDKEKCLGCGVCAIGCEQGAVRLVRMERSKPFPGPRELFKTIALENENRIAKGEGHEPGKGN